MSSGHKIPFSVITPTGDRPIPFRMCCEFIQRQTIIPTEWIVVDDGEAPSEVPNLPWVKYVRRKNREYPKHSLTMQMVEALKHVTTDRVIIFEDDDWYAPGYCAYMLDLLGDHDIAGIGNTVYYNVPERRYYIHDNHEHAAWCNTAFSRRAFPKMLQVAKDCHQRNYPYMDLTLWRALKGADRNLDLSNPRITLGIKGMPGRLGTCSGHRSTDRFQQDTKGASFLSQEVGADIALYQPYMLRFDRHQPISVVSLVNDKRAWKANVQGTLPESRVQFVPIYQPRSAALGLNHGIALAQHDLIVCCHQDVRFSRGWIDTLIEQMQKIPVQEFGVLGTYGLTKNLTGSGHILSGSKKLRHGVPPEEAVYLDEHCLVIRKSAELWFDEQCPGFDMYGADLCLSAWKRGMPCFSVDAFLHHLSDNLGQGEGMKIAMKWFVGKWTGRSPFHHYRTTCTKEFLL